MHALRRTFLLTLLSFCSDDSASPQAWRHSMELLAREVMPRFKDLVPR